jgi:hypothetical protein
MKKKTTPRWKAGIFPRLFGVPAFLALVFLFAGCVTRANVMVGISETMKEHYAIFPSIEVDIAAVTDAEANDIKSEGVGNYFSPNSSLRTNLAPFTVFFSEEHTAPVFLWAHGEAWKKWQKKKPTNLAIMASLPHDPDAPPADPRILMIPLEKRPFSSTVYVEVDPKKVIQVFGRPQDPRLHDAPEGTPTEPPAKSIEQDLISEGIIYAF